MFTRRRPFHLGALGLAAVLGAAASAPAWSTGGRLEINQTCAVETGCFPGDAAGFPIEIEAAGSYVLTSDLFVDDAAVSAIVAPPSVEGVHVDLAGFRVEGAVSCAPSGTGFITCNGGVSVGTRLGPGATLRDGSIRGFGVGVDVSTRSLVEGVHVDLNGTGIRARDGRIRIVSARVTRSGSTGIWSGGSQGDVVVDDCVVALSNGVGVDLILGGALEGSTVRDSRDAGVRGRRARIVGNLLRGHGGTGIECRDCRIEGNEIATSGSHGIDAEGRNVVVGNRVFEAFGTGILVRDGNLVAENHVSDSRQGGIQAGKANQIRDNVVFDNVGHGITANSSSHVVGNTVRESTGFGLFFLGSQSNYRGNLMSVNTGGSVGFSPGSSALDLGQNSCGNSTSCP